MQAKHLADADPEPDPYLVVKIDKHVIHETKVVENTHAPVWNEQVLFKTFKRKPPRGEIPRARVVGR